MDRSALKYWESFPAGRLRPMPAPIAPGVEDISYLEARVTEFADEVSGNPVDAMLLGVTPRIASMHWPVGTRLVAVDWAESMIRRFWPADGLAIPAQVVRGDWRQLPLATGSRNVVVGDGFYTPLGTFADIRLVNAEVRRVLRSGGVYCARNFARPRHARTVAAVFDDLRAGNIANVFVLRWLLAMAAHGTSREGVVLDAVWRAWREHAPDPERLFAACGWPADSAWSIERWKGLQIHYSFPSSEELRELAAPWFDVIAFHLPDYAWGECFPSMVMRARG